MLAVVDLSPVDVGALATALTAVLRTPIPGGTLASVAPANRLTELEFEFPLAGGDLAQSPGAVHARTAADIVVVGASTQTHRVLGGSVASRLVRVGRWPITVVP